MEKRFTYFYSLLLTALFLLPWSGVKAQDEIVVLSEDFESDISSRWVLRDCHSDTYRTNHGSSAHGGTYDFRFNYNSNPPQYLVSTQELNIPSNALGVNVSFYYVTQSSSYQESFQVGYSTTTNETDAFTWLAEVTTTSTAWLHYTDNTFPVTTKYFAIRYTANYQYRLFIDDVEITYTPLTSCPKPSTPVASDISATSATFTWSAGGTETSWQYICLPAATPLDWSDANVQTTSTASATVSPLTPNTDYKFYVRADCGGDQSGNASLAFKTPCGAQSLPFSEDFSGTIDCWKMVDCAANTGLYNNSKFRFYYNTKPPQYLISPEFAATSNEVKVEFDYYKYTSGTETFKIGYSTTTNETTAFTWGDVITCTNSSSTSPSHYSETFPAGVKYVSIKYTSNDQYYLYIDNFSVSEVVVPTCFVPTGLNASAITANSAALSWTEGKSGDDAWVVEYSTASDFSSSTELPATTNTSFPLSSLNPQTTYYVRVKTNCGANGYSDPSDVISFTTLCGAESLPFSEDFSGAIPCWTLVSCHSETKVVSGEFKFRYSTTPPQYLISPELEVIANAVQVEFDYRIQSTTYPESFVVGYSTTTNDISAFTWGTEQTGLTNTATVNYSETLPAGVKYVAIQYTANDKSALYIDNFSVSEAPSCSKPTSVSDATSITPEGATFTWSAGGSETQYDYCVVAKNAAADGWVTLGENVRTVTITGKNANTNYDFYVRSNCGSDQSDGVKKSFKTAAVNAPTGVSVSAVGTTTATASWTAAAGITTYQYCVVAAGAAATWDKSVNDVTVALSNLTASTSYDFYVRSYYAGNGATAAASKVTFTTACEAITVDATHPFEENFDGITSGIPACWSNAEGTTTNNNYKWSSATGGQSGRCVRFESKNNVTGKTNILASPAFDLQADADVTFYVKNKKGGDYKVQISVDGGARTDLITGLTNISAWTQKEATLSAYKNHTIQLFFCGTSNWSESNDGYLYLDEVKITPQACRKPASDPVASGVTANEATLTWTAGGTNTEYQFCLVENGETPVWDETNVVSALTKSFDNLQPTTSYDFYVRTYCGAGDGNQSEARMVTFHTGCGVFNAPLDMDFNNATANAVPECWDNSQSTMTTASYKWQVVTYSGRNSSKCLKCTSQATESKTNILVSPKIRLTAGNVLSFWCKNTAGDNLVVKVTKDAGADFTTVLDASVTMADWTLKYADLSAFADETVEIYFCNTTLNDFDGGSIYIDDIRIARGEIFEDVANAASTSRLSSLNGQTTDVITTRPMQFNGNYNTLCLPFNLSTAQLAETDCPLNNCEFKVFDYAEVEDGELVVSIANASSVVAATPYFFRYVGAAEGDRRAVLYKDVTITASEAGEKKDEDDPVWYKGVFQTVTLSAESTDPDATHNFFFLSAANTLYWPAVDYTANAFRAYFYIDPSTVTTIKKGMPLRFTESPRVPTAVDNVESETKAEKRLENNQVIIIRNGVKYSIQGQKIQ